MFLSGNKKSTDENKCQVTVYVVIVNSENIDCVKRLYSAKQYYSHQEFSESQESQKHNYNY